LFIIARGDCTLKIKIIGNPGKQPVETLKVWLEESLKKFNLLYPEVWLIFIKNAKQIEKISQKYEKGVKNLSQAEKSLIAKAKFAYLRKAIYIPKYSREKGIPPIILITRKEGEISEYDILDETAHIAEDEHGWNKIKSEAFEILLRDYQGLWITPGEFFSFFPWLNMQFFDFFSNEMMCQYGLITEVFRLREEKLNHWIKQYPLKKKISKIEYFGTIMAVVFRTTLPPSYSQKEGEEKLEKIVIDHIRQMGMEELYREIKTIVSGLESPPKVANIYQCGAKIIELAQEFLEKQ